MERFSEKVFLQLKMPTEEASLSDEKRIRIALETLGYEHVNIPLSVMRKLYPLCRVNVTLVYREGDWTMVNIGAGKNK